MVKSKAVHAPAAIGFTKARSAFFFAAIFSGVINLLMLTGPLFMIQVYDRVLSSKSVPTLVALSLVAVGLYLFMGLFEFIRTRIMVRVGMLYEEEVRLPVFERVLWHAVTKSPGVGTQPIRDLETVRQFVSGPAPFSIFDMPWVPLFVAVNFLFHPWLGYLTAAGVVSLFLLALLSELAARRGQAEAMQSALKAHGMAEEAAGSAEVLKAMGMQKAIAARWSQAHQKSVGLQVVAADRASIIGATSKVVRMVLQSAGLALGAYLAIKGDITAGVIIAATTIMSRALAPVEQAIAHWRSYVAYRKAQQRLQRLLASVDAEQTRMELPAPKGQLSLDGITVLAPQSSKPLLQGIHFELKPGSCLGVIGPSGAGKSSLARAIVGAWPVARGNIRLDGASLDQWPEEQLGCHVGYVPQDVVLFTGTIEDNISRFAVDPAPAAVVEAARCAHAHEMILTLPEGYNTVVGPTGIQLSGGQRQRVALARALYADPALLVLDEPNANLDGDGEAALMKAIQNACARGTSVVLIAHRPRVLRIVDYVLYLKDGRQVDFGPRDIVLQKLQSATVAPASARGPGNLAVVKE